jgi:hypothetical protein
VNCLLSPKKWPQSLPAITEKSVAHQIATLLIKHQYIHRSEKDPARKGFLRVSTIYFHCQMYLLTFFIMQPTDLKQTSF